ncbi:MAG: TolC family protein [Helicobacteraceae bacterium]|nr:TolC family protein [Helicobacteraceae bacterium]
MRVLFLLLALFLHISFGRDLSYDEFISKAYENSQELVMQEAMTKSIQAEGRALSAWDSPYAEVSPSIVRNKDKRKFEVEAQVLLMITPKMPWVTSIIEDSYNIKNVKNLKMTELQKNIIAIGAKRAYLEYLVYKEQLEIYKNKEQLSLNLYEIAKKRFEANRIAKVEFLRFKSDYSNALNELKTQNLLVESALKKLQVLINDDSFSRIVDLDFYFMPSIDLESSVSNSIYNEILSLEAEDYEKSAKLVGRSIMDSFQIGAGYTFGQNSINFKVIIPFPITPKANHQQSALMELQSASLRQNEINKQKIRQNATALYSQIKQQEEIIKLAEESQKDSFSLFEIMQKGFDAGSISVFEYLNTKNSYLTSQIQTTQEKLNYLNLLSLFEENIGRSVK